MLILSLILVFLSVFSLQCSKDESEERAVPVTVSRAVTQVAVAVLKKGPVFRAYVAVGTVAPWDFARITPKVTGRIDRILVEEGGPVEKGALLMMIDDFDYTRIVENATALRNQARVNREKSGRDFARIDRLFKDQTVSEQRYHDMRTAFDLAGYAYDQAAVALKKAERDLRDCQVTAPISGILTAKHVNEGELTGPQVVAFVSMQMDKVKVEVDLPEDAYGYVKTGNSCAVTVDAIPDNRFKGTIAMIHPTIDPASRTVKVTIRLDNPELRLRSGMTARAKVIQKARDHVLYAPKAAFVTGEDGYFVYRLVEDRVHRVPVEVGVQGDGVFEVTGGLSAGDQVVVQGLVGLRDNMAVTAKTIEIAVPKEGSQEGSPGVT